MAYMDRDRDRRDIRARWTVTAKLTMTTASQIGSQEGDHSDTTFGLDRSGVPVLHGTNLAGALRSALNDRRTGYRSRPTSDRDEAWQLFGAMKEHESLAIVFDSVATAPVQSSIRDGVAIDPDKRTAEDRLKFDREVALPGIVFPVRVDVVITHGADEAAVMADLADALDALTEGKYTGIRLGARKTRGLGQCAASEFRAIRYVLGANPDGWKQYAGSDRKDPTAKQPAFDSARAAINSILPLPDPGPDKRSEAVFTFDIRVRGSLIIRSPGTKAADPDAVHLSENGCHLLSGTSLAGALRAHAARIARTLGTMDLLAGGDDPIIQSLFGPSPTEVKEGASPQASRVVVQETALEEARAHRHMRVKIDRFTGGAVDTALFEETPTLKGKGTFLVRIINPTDAEIGLMALVARDVAAGQVPFGGEAATGRGTVTAAVKLTANGETLDIPTPKAPGDADKLAPYVNALIQNGGATP